MQNFRTHWLTALAAFVLAGATGAFLRFGVLYGMAELSYVNVRHAHSHLMYFGWVTPALMALMAAHLPRLTGRPLSPWLARIIPLTIGLGLLAYFPFLLYGYRPVEWGGARLPLSVIAAALNVLAWYAFAWVWRRQTRGAPPTRALRLWNAAVIFLLAATLGVIGLPLLVAAGIEDPLWSLLLTHVFLDLFSEGWFVLGGLGLAYALFPQAARHPWARPAGGLLIAGLPVVFLLYLPVGLTPPALRWVGSAGGLLVAAGTLGNVAALWPAAGRAWRAPLAFLALKGVAQVGLLLPAVAAWAEGARLRVPYLHWLLLGFATLGLFAAAERVWGVGGRRWMTAAVIVLTLTLMPLTGLWPVALGGVWTLHAAAWAALGPVAAATGVLVGEGLRDRPAQSGRVW
jgi:hypothetical protein